MRPRSHPRFETTPLAEVLQRVTDVDLNGSMPPKKRHRDGVTDGRLRILVVDDEHSIADTLALILEGRGYEVTIAYDAETALAKYDQVKPSLVLSDVVMPGMDGVEMAIAMRERGGCPIMLLSGQAATTDLLHSARRRGHDFELLTKPIHPTELLERIALCIGVGQRNLAVG